MFLFTFETLTDAFKADAFLKTKYSVEIVHVPFSLSSTCYGMGLTVSVSETKLSDVISDLKNEGLSFKRVWKQETAETFGLVLEVGK